MNGSRPSGGRSARWLQLLRELLRPQLLLTAPLLVAALWVYAASVPKLPPPERVELATPETPPTPAEGVLVLAPLDGGASVRERVTLPLPSAQPQRLAALLAALRERLLRDGVWPAALPPPTVFWLDGREPRAVLDLRPAAGAAVSVAQEQALAESLAATVREAGAEVLFLRHGAPAATLLGHVAVPSAFDPAR